MCVYLKGTVYQRLIEVDHHAVLAVVVDADLRQEVFGWRLERENRVCPKDGGMKREEERRGDNQSFEKEEESVTVISLVRNSEQSSKLRAILCPVCDSFIALVQTLHTALLLSFPYFSDSSNGTRGLLRL